MFAGAQMLVVGGVGGDRAFWNLPFCLSKPGCPWFPFTSPLLPPTPSPPSTLDALFFCPLFLARLRIGAT